MSTIALENLRYALASALLRHRKVLSVNQIAAILPGGEPDSVERVVQLLLQTLPVRRRTRVMQTSLGNQWEEFLELEEPAG